MNFHQYCLVKVAVYISQASRCKCFDSLGYVDFGRYLSNREVGTLRDGRAAACGSFTGEWRPAHVTVATALLLSSLPSVKSM